MVSSKQTPLKTTKVFLVCSGLGHVLRGYESFTQQCFDTLASEPSLDITLFQGKGHSSSNIHTLRNLPRNHSFTQKLALCFRKHSYLSEPYFLEQTSFFLSLIPYLFREKPEVVIFSDFSLGTMLWHWRRISNLSYKLLFSNGAPNGPPFSRMDHVQHLTPSHYQAAINAGESAENHSLVPYGIQLDRKYTSLSLLERDSLRRKLNLPIERHLILSVGAINKSHKRMDYLIKEVANLAEPRPYLLLLGQFDKESREIVKLGNLLLGADNFQAKTVTSEEIDNYYKSADLFVLASLNEGFGRVFLEAMEHGLPCLAHDYEVARFVLGDHGYFANFACFESLTILIRQVLDRDTKREQAARHQSVYERFSWEYLRRDYTEMIKLCASRASLRSRS